MVCLAETDAGRLHAANTLFHARTAGYEMRSSAEEEQGEGTGRDEENTCWEKKAEELIIYRLSDVR